MAKSVHPGVESALAALKRQSSTDALEGMARYKIPSDRAFGVPMREIQALAKELGREHGLAAGLWETGWYEARVLAAYVDEPSRVTPTQMERWCHDFDNWAICDTVCFALFDRTSHVWDKVDRWAAAPDTYVKRAAFASLWGLTVHDKSASDALFLHGLTLIQHAADDDRLYVKKAVDMALRAIGKRNEALRLAAVDVARRLTTSENKTAQWVGKHALTEISVKR